MKVLARYVLEVRQKWRLARFILKSWDPEDEPGSCILLKGDKTIRTIDEVVMSTPFTSGFIYSFLVETVRSDTRQRQCSASISGLVPSSSSALYYPSSWPTTSLPDAIHLFLRPHSPPLGTSCVHPVWIAP